MSLLQNVSRSLLLVSCLAAFALQDAGGTTTEQTGEPPAEVQVEAEQQAEADAQVERVEKVRDGMQAVQEEGSGDQIVTLKARGLEALEGLGGKYESPRQVLAAFYTAMEEYAVFEVDSVAKDHLLDLALSTMQFDGDRQDGEELALDLLFILDRLEDAHLHNFPDVAKLEEISLEEGSRKTYWKQEFNQGTVQVYLDFQIAGLDTLNERWLISGWTFKRVPGYARRLANLPTLARVGERRSLEAQARHWREWARYEMRSRMPAVMLGKGFLLENWQWVGIAILVFIGLVLDRLVRFFIKRVVVRILKSERMSLPLPEEALANFERPFGLFVVGWFLGDALPLLSLGSTYEAMLVTISGFVAIFGGIWAIYRLIDVVAGVLESKARLTHNRFDDLLVPLMRRTSKIVVTIFGLVYIASRISDDFYGVVAGLSIGSLAIGFSAKDSIENLFGTFTVLLDKPFALGDWITVGKIDGTVEEVGFRSTRVRTFYNSVISVPNSTFIKAHVDNWGSRRYRRITSTLSITYDTPPTKIEAFCEAVRQLIRDHPYTRKNYYHVYLNGFGDSSLDIMLYCFVETPDWSTELREKHRLFNDILRVAGELGVEFAFPTQSIHLVKPEDLEHAGTPPDIATGEEQGRDAGRRIAATGLERFDGEKPPPVVID